MHTHLLGCTFKFFTDRNTCQKYSETHIAIVLPLVTSGTWISKQQEQTAHKVNISETETD